jgi:hypothetical protein
MDAFRAGINQSIPVGKRLQPPPSYYYCDPLPSGFPERRPTPTRIAPGFISSLLCERGRMRALLRTLVAPAREAGGWKRSHEALMALRDSPSAAAC